MSETAQAISLGAAFVAGVSGSAHCFAMCGGLAGALGMRARAMGQSPQRALLFAVLTQSGRVASYALAGAMAGIAGALLTDLMSWVHIAAWLRVVAGVLLLAVAMRIAFGWNAFAALERVGGRMWSRHFSKAAHASSSRIGIMQSLALGAAWGWLPCGLVYSMTLYAAFAGDAWQGALIMLAFGAGTLPSMVSSSVLAAQLARALKNPKARWVAAAALIVFGVWTIASALVHLGH